MALVTEEEFVATYDGGAHRDAWTVVEEYRRATAYASRKNVGSSATASALDLPRGRIRTWIDDGGSPHPVEGLDVARKHGWLECEFGDPVFDGLNRLVANVFSGGSIAERFYQPSFAMDDANDAAVGEALEAANVDYHVVEDRDERADEARPKEGASVLGRVLAVLGAPVGPKAEQRLSLPDYLDDAPADVRRRFATVYLANRAKSHDGKATLTIDEERNRSYLSDLAALLDEVADGGVDLREQNIVISADAARSLELAPE